MSISDAAIRARWLPRLIVRKRLAVAAKRAHTKAQLALNNARTADKHPRAHLIQARDQAANKLEQRREDVAFAERILNRHTAKVAMPVKHILSMANDWHPGHDGIDLICEANAPLFAICNAKVIDVRAGGWWGKGACARAGHPISDGDGIIQLECLVNVGPFLKGDHFGYGHAEGACVKVGQIVRAGERIGRSGFANAWHVHFMANHGMNNLGIGTIDPAPFLKYAKEHS